MLVALVLPIDNPMIAGCIFYAVVSRKPPMVSVHVYFGTLKCAILQSVACITHNFILYVIQKLCKQLTNFRAILNDSTVQKSVNAQTCADTNIIVDGRRWRGLVRHASRVELDVWSQGPVV